MKRLLLLIGYMFCTGFVAFGQVDCGNIGFEQGNMNGWTLTYGAVTDADQKTVYGVEATGTQNNEHYVTSASDGNDPKISAIPMVAPGSSHSIRIGNIVEGGHYSRIRTEYKVTVDNTLFQYKFAVILQNTGVGTTSGTGQGGQNANHEPYQKPGFNILIYDSNGSELTCSSYDIQLQGTNTVEGFLSSGDIQYRNWTTGAIDLRSYVGKTITIVVTAHGCTRQRHFGYAYFDAECLKSEIKSLTSCPDADGFMTLMAPEGFGKYTWNNGATTQIVKVKANLGDKFSVKVVPPGSLNESCALSLDYVIPFKKTSAEVSQTVCEGIGVTLGDTVYKTSGTFIRNVSKSNVCDSIVTLHLTVNPVPRYTQTRAICAGDSLAVGDTLYRTPGTFVRTVKQITGCDSLVTTNLTVVPMALSVTSLIRITRGDSAEVHVLVDPPGDYDYLWDKAEGLTCPTCTEMWVHPAVSTQYVIHVSDPDKVCNKEGKVYVQVKPCGIYAPSAFTPNSDQDNQVFFVYGNSCVKQVREMTVYNRWGEVIYQKSNFKANEPANGWDGTYRGQTSEPGVYPYKIQVEFLSGELMSYKGVVNLIR